MSLRMIAKQLERIADIMEKDLEDTLETKELQKATLELIQSKKGQAEAAHQKAELDLAQAEKKIFGEH